MMISVLLAALATTRAESSTSCPSSTSKGTCVTGGEAYQFLENVTTPDGCCNACNQDPKCLAWMLKNTSQNCALKAVAGPVRHSLQCLYSGIMSNTPPGPTPPAPAETTSFATVFLGGAVLQHGIEAHVWGTDTVGTKVSVLLDGQAVATATTDADGKWTAKIPPQSPAFNRTLTAKGSGAVNATISFGVAILCSGQSNMGMPVANYKGSNFSAENGTAEAAASVRYTGRIWVLGQNGRRGWVSASPMSLGGDGPGFSAVCWYAGRALSDHLGSNMPIGLLEAAVGGSPIEYWISKDAIAQCEVDVPQVVGECDNHLNDSVFYEQHIQPLIPYPIGAVIWDQAERDTKCPGSTAAYPCMQQQLVSSWRQSFFNSFAFVGVQLHGYTAALVNGTGKYPGSVTSEMVFHMRLQQDTLRSRGAEAATLIATYDLSPFGSVHWVDKENAAPRLGRALQKVLLDEKDVIFEGPRVAKVTASATTSPSADSESTVYNVTVSFSGGSAPFSLGDTHDCVTCCDLTKNNGHTVDFDASADGITFVNSTAVTLHDESEATVSFLVSLPAAPVVVRHTAASIWPQCALYNAEGLPAMPFRANITEA